MNYIKVEISKEKGEISVENGGRGIPIEIHKEYNMYVPQLIFGNLLTSSNYNDDIKKVTGGRNGYGAKLTNIFSKKFVVETADSNQKKKYVQVFSNNMLKCDPPEITKYKKEDYTKITFKPDLSKFKMQEFDEDILSLFRKRVYDLAGVTPKTVNVYLNGQKLKVKDFSSYMSMYLDYTREEDEVPPIKIFEVPHERWEVGFSLSESQFQQVSFVNSICTTKGGTHVNYVTEKIVKAIQEIVQKKGKNLTIRPQHIKQHMWVFVNCLIENPAFDSQTKETLTLKKENFGSSFELSEEFLKKVKKSGLIERCLSFAKTREEVKLQKKLNAGNKKSNKLFGIDKLDDANYAGTKKSTECTLILTEGDSAKSLAMAGIDVVGRNTFGCFPLRGKMLNVRDARPKQISNNVEVQNVMKILGLRLGEEYHDIKSLRYGSIMIMTDQDVDGSHIKGLIINFIHTFWPSLIKLNGFVREFITPIIKASKGRTELSFYSLPQYQDWLNNERHGNVKGWKIKYYKGLGTSSNKEAKEYFSNLEKNRIFFDYSDDKDDESIDLAFNKKKAEDRKKWIANYAGEDVDITMKTLKYEHFINKELVQFSIYDNQRSIPSLCDGLKPSERKILFGCFKRNLKAEIKVAQLIGYISENSAYHHGEQSLASTIVAMAQNFVGSNNINLLMPNGQFGSRNMGGKDSASPRYIHTTLNKVTRSIFNESDLPLMDYIVEEGQKIEPKWYMPIIPMVLVNGAEGIGTGWSTNIPCFNPHDIVESIKNKIKTGKFLPISPWYKGFQGEIKKTANDSFTYLCTGKYHWDEDDPNTLFITEIPVKKWTRDYKIFLQELMGVQMKKSKEEENKKAKGKRSKSKAKQKRKNSQKSNSEDEGNESASKDDDKDSRKKPIILDDMKEHHTDNRVRNTFHRQLCK